MSLIALRPPPAWRTRVPAPSRLRPVISAIAFVMVVRDKPVTVERRLMPPQPKSNALSATYQRCCASLRVDSTFNQRFSSAESPRLGIQHSVENSRPFVQFILSQPLIFNRSRGIPRVISVICDNALVAGFAANQRPVGKGLVLEICHDFDLVPPGPVGGVWAGASGEAEAEAAKTLEHALARARTQVDDEVAREVAKASALAERQHRRDVARIKAEAAIERAAAVRDARLAGRTEATKACAAELARVRAAISVHARRGRGGAAPPGDSRPVESTIGAPPPASAREATVRPPSPEGQVLDADLTHGRRVDAALGALPPVIPF